MVIINNISHSNDKSSAVFFTLKVDTDDLLSISSGNTLFMSGVSREVVVKYAEQILKHFDVLYGDPVVCCKYHNSLKECGTYTAEIYVQNKEQTE